MLLKIGNFLYISTGQLQRLLLNTFWHSASPRRAPSFTILHNTESTWIKHKLKINYLHKIRLRRLPLSTHAWTTTPSRNQEHEMLTVLHTSCGRVISKPALPVLLVLGRK